ncbi:hypothetical protein NM208_g8418 [Fusarium decemcellulare]|uniref:Uncharacterized protein n=2 Tax=Fusarium decemcellulare TaxID=57161 RepID=A0ACC1S5D4_9HYPO|nr:hypothetical protein NM208_g9864 [Fusarium decemcellulare]KAJ3532488.1 hypothetical protein NM208_g8418 [Fusarium decemcellulare]
MSTTQLPKTGEDLYYDYVIVGGGTAGCVIASRLAEYLPEKKILLIEAGPSDLSDDRVLDLRKWLSLIGSELDFDYSVTEQPNGNSYLRQSRAKVLGGCSSHNTLISFVPFEYDCKIWESLGAKGWNFDTFVRLIKKLRLNIQPVDERHRNQTCKDWVDSASTALGVPKISNFNDVILKDRCLTGGAGFFNISYDPDTWIRSSASTAYIHPFLRGDEKRPNLTVLTNSWVSKVIVRGDVVTGVNLTLQDGSLRTVIARKETVICAGAIDTPRLLLHSGIGPEKDLTSLGIPLAHKLSGVGENLQDHPEGIVIWELNKRIPANQTAMDTDAGVFLRRENFDAGAKKSAANPDGIQDGGIADIQIHSYQMPFTINTTRLGYPEIQNGFAFCVAPNIPRSRSRGRLYLNSSDPSVKPSLDFRYFTDAEGYDAATLLYGMRACRKIAESEPFKSWVKREVFPGAHIQSDEELSHYARKASHTVFHPVGTCRMGDVEDELAVVDSVLKVRGLKKLRIADASVFPTIPSVNPMLVVFAVAERCAELIAEDAGWKQEHSSKL